MARLALALGAIGCGGARRSGPSAVVRPARYDVVTCSGGRCGDVQLDPGLGITGAPTHLVEVDDTRFVVAQTFDMTPFPDAPAEWCDRDLNSMCEHVAEDCRATLWRIRGSDAEALIEVPRGGSRELLGATELGAFVRTPGSLVFLPVEGGARVIARPEEPADAWLDLVHAETLGDGTILVRIAGRGATWLYAVPPNTAAMHILATDRWLPRPPVSAETSPPVTPGFACRGASEGVWATPAGPCTWVVDRDWLLVLANGALSAFRMPDLSESVVLSDRVAGPREVEVVGATVRFFTDLTPRFAPPHASRTRLGTYASAFGLVGLRHEWSGSGPGATECVVCAGTPGEPDCGVNVDCEVTDRIEAWIEARSATTLSDCPTAAETFACSIAALAMASTPELARCAGASIAGDDHLETFERLLEDYQVEQALTTYRLALLGAMARGGGLAEPEIVTIGEDGVQYRVGSVERRLPVERVGCAVRFHVP